MNNFKLFYIFCIFIFSLVKIQAEPNKVVQYNKDGISFSYPATWTLTADVSKPEMRYILVEGPGNSIFVIQIYPQKNYMKLNEYVDEFAKETKISGRWMNSKTTRLEPVSGPGVLNKGIRRVFYIKVVFLPVYHFSDTFKVEKSNKTVFLMSQCATLEYYRAKQGINMIKRTFRLK